MNADTPRQLVRAKVARLRALLMGLCMAVALDVCAKGDTLIFVSTQTPPIWSASIPGGGMGGELLHLLSDAAGVTYAINYLPPARFRNNTSPYIVGNPNLLTTERNRAIFPIGVLHSAYFYYRPRHEPLRIDRLADLSGHTLGVLRGTVEDRTQFERLKIRVQETDSIETLLRMLRKGRIDVALMVELAGEHVIRQEFPSEERDFVFSRIPGSAMPITVIVDLDAPNGNDIAKRYRLALGKILHNPQYEAILRKYHGHGGAAIKTDCEVLGRLLNLYEST